MMYFKVSSNFSVLCIKSHYGHFTFKAFIHLLFQNLIYLTFTFA